MARQRHLLALRWGDMDAYRHVNNVHLMRLLEEARVRSFGVPATEGGTSMLATGMVVARHEIDYLAPLDFRVQPIAVDLWVSGVGDASFRLGYEVCEADDSAVGAPRTYARATSTMVSYDFQTARPRRLDAAERATLHLLSEEPNGGT